jgi:hypothetical protein
MNPPFPISLSLRSIILDKLQHAANTFSSIIVTLGRFISYSVVQLKNTDPTIVLNRGRLR